MSLKYQYSSAAVGFIVEVFDADGNKVAEANGFSKKDAKKLVQAKLGIEKASTKKVDPDKQQAVKVKPKAPRKHSPRGSIMTGLSGKTSSKNWNTVK